MDSRMSNAIEGMNHRKLSLDDKLPFTCTHCGGCCVHQEELLLNPWDIFRIAKEMKLTVEEWVCKYGESYIGPNSGMPIIRIRPMGKTRRCPLLKNNRCSVHRAKPSVCGLYPLGRGFCYQQDNDENEGTGNAEVIYFHGGCICGSQTGTQTVREWLEEFQLLEGEKFFIQWSKVFQEVSEFLRKLEKSLQKKEIMNLAWNLVTHLLYLRYDTQKDFQEQFEQNYQELREHITQIEEMGGMEL